MPILSSIEARRPAQDDFGEPAHEVMRHVFEIHADFGRFVDEAVSKRELASHMKSAALEGAVDARQDAFVAHARKLVQHTTLGAMLWANITGSHVTFSTLR